jgi:uncharacterized protein YndB with AHSA1/START domain
MYDIYHVFPIHVSAEKVYLGVATPAGIDQWWTKKSSGKPEAGSTWSLFFGPENDWKSVVTKNEPKREFEFLMTDADEEWLGTRIGFILDQHGPAKTELTFYHTGWPGQSENYKVSNFCWAMYLRILKKYLETGEQVPYERRLNV